MSGEEKARTLHYWSKIRQALKKGNLMGIVSDHAAVTHSLETRLEASGAEGQARPEDYEALERRLLASIQMTSELLRSNRWAPGAAPPLPDVAAGGKAGK